MSKTYLDNDDIAKLEKAAKYARDRLLVRLLFRLGCRISEVLGISVRDIDLNIGTITIQHLKTRINLSCPECCTRISKMAIFCPGCGAKIKKIIVRENEHRRQRILPIDIETLVILKDYIDRGGPLSRGDKKILFGITRGHAWRIVTKIASDAGFDHLVNPETGKTRNISPHRLRDAFAVHAVKINDSGDGLRLLQEYLGHQNISTTMRYRRVSGEEQEDWYHKLWAEGKDSDGTTN